MMMEGSWFQAIIIILDGYPVSLEFHIMHQPHALLCTWAHSSGNFRLAKCAKDSKFLLAF